eukprot:CAMPEP_0201476692 /NCGR_PEP_ID=MMETSP0151_2-20130828/1844_1 /ASSEMBLY_ACC=CAM_ASM_000257 /TAXON_ID=200890 /ORGANISM="Paramoeba atlantica, Strain 621/1 / CCAP 1560/9" /LENGTH=100 /DNA_ID=CAMNT_0047857143 /DNA_START=26 /DNA_END=328 /DNA_ORIENTATION=+
MSTAVRLSFHLENPSSVGDLQVMAKEINETPGFVRKYWLHNPGEKKAGGFYIFDSRENADGYIAGPIFKRLQDAVKEIEIEIWDLSNMRPLSHMTHAQFP